MDETDRKITKIAREAEKLVLLTLREEGVGTAEIDMIHALRPHPGCTQARLPELAVLRQEDVPVKVAVFRNDALGMIGHIQRGPYGGQLFASALLEIRV